MTDVLHCRSVVVRERGRSWRLKRCLFIGRVVNTALSGIKAFFAPRKHSISRLTSLVTCLARRVMAGEKRASKGVSRTMSNKEVLRFWKMAPRDAEARVRRLKWAQTLVQDPAHHTQLITATLGKLPSEPNPTLGPGTSEILPEANPWAVRRMADLEELEPYDGEGSHSAYGSGREGSFLDRELAEDFVAMDITILRLRSLAVEGPTVGFPERDGSPSGIVGGRSSTVVVLF